jgi:hypothetical protein
MIADDPSLFLSDFGVSVTAGAVTGLGILDMPSEIILDNQVITTDYTLTCESAKFGALLYGDAVTVDGINYQVRNVVRLTDGVFCTVSLSRLAPDGTAVGRDPREFGLADLTDVSLTTPAQGDLLVNNGTEWVDTNEVDGGGAG